MKRTNRTVEEIREDIRKTKKGLKNAERKRKQCIIKINNLMHELKEVEKDEI